MGIGSTRGLLRWITASGASILLLGVVHLASMPGVMRGVPGNLPEEFRRAFLFMFGAAGAAAVFAGLLVLWGGYGMARQWRGAWTLALLAGLFTAVMGGGAVAAMPRNPFSGLLLLAGLSVLPPLWMWVRGPRERGSVLDFRREEPGDRRTLH